MGGFGGGEMRWWAVEVRSPLTHVRGQLQACCWIVSAYAAPSGQPSISSRELASA